MSARRFPYADTEISRVYNFVDYVACDDKCLCARWRKEERGLDEEGGGEDGGVCVYSCVVLELGERDIEG